MKNCVTIDFSTGAAPEPKDPRLEAALWLLAMYQYRELREQLPNLPDWGDLGYEGRGEWKKRARSVVEFHAESWRHDDFVLSVWGGEAKP